MKTIKVIGALALFAACSLLAATVARSLSVQTRAAVVRNRPSFLGRKVGTIPYGTRVTVVQTRRGWAEVITPRRLRGWVHMSALTERRILMRAGTRKVGTSTDREELALATKGFDEQVERQYRKTNPTLNYTWVDWMERIVVSPRTMERFLREGGLVPREDASW